MIIENENDDVKCKRRKEIKMMIENRKKVKIIIEE
jgi:hypothetical protein